MANNIITIFDEVSTFMYTLDKRLFGEKMESNKYFGTLCVLFVAVLGGCTYKGSYVIIDFIKNVIDWNVGHSMIAAIAISFILWGLCLAESIVASLSVLATIERTFIYLGIMIVAFLIGAFVSDALVLYFTIAILVLMVLTPLAPIVIRYINKNTRENKF